MNEQTVNIVATARRALKRSGYLLRKSRSSCTYRIIDADLNAVFEADLDLDGVLGWAARFSAS